MLNTAEGTRVGLVDTNQNFYRPFGIKYKGLKLLDVAQTNIAMYFSEVAEYIDEALKTGGKNHSCFTIFTIDVLSLKNSLRTRKLSQISFRQLFPP